MKNIPALTTLIILLLHIPNLCASEVVLRRVPDGGIQPQAVADDQGDLHLIYFKGEAANGDVFYVRSGDGGATFSKALRVNSQAGSVMAIGNIRGAHLALGKNGRIHVAWMGSNTAEPRGPNKEAPMLYARVNDAGTAFEEQRNVIASHYGLDGGGTVAADGAGHVYVLWHGMGDEKGEEHRRVWVARSTDEGKTFSAEKGALQQETGACGCCGMNALADGGGKLYVLYRAAGEKVNRDMYLLSSQDGGGKFEGVKLDSWNANMCPMSSEALSAAGQTTAIAWENKGQIFYTRIAADKKAVTPIAAPGAGQGRKHPAIAINAAGEMLLAWTEGMGWQKGGSLHWQLYDKGGAALEKGESAGVPAWSLVAAVSRKDGGFAILY